MNEEHKRFIEEELIPFILREHGNGFAMSTWRYSHSSLWKLDAFDDVKSRLAPSCGTIACIGGSIEMLKGLPSSGGQPNLGKFIGLTKSQACGLFFSWRKNGRDLYGWPLKFRKRYSHARTPLSKARVVVQLLRQVIKTNGECLGHEY